MKWKAKWALINASMFLSVVGGILVYSAMVLSGISIQAQYLFCAGMLVFSLSSPILMQILLKDWRFTMIGLMAPLTWILLILSK